MKYKLKYIVSEEEKRYIHALSIVMEDVEAGFLCA